MKTAAPSQPPVNVSVREWMQIACIGRTKTYELIDRGVIKTLLIGRKRLIVLEPSLAALENNFAA